MNAKPKGNSTADAIGVWLAIVAIILVTVVAFRGTWLAGRRSLLNDLGMGGFRVTIDAALEPGEGGCIVQVWRDGGWTDVER